MRSFTNASVFDNTLPVGDGLMEIGTNVPIAELKDAMEDWFRRKSYLPKGSALIIEPCVIKACGADTPASARPTPVASKA